MGLESGSNGGGVPLGGLGTGFIEMGADGLFRNITVQNNRTTDECIPVAEQAFLAVRVASAEQTYARVLRRSAPPGATSPEAPPPLRPEQTEWRGLYPTSSSHLLDPACPADVTWTCFAPLVPFDHDASTLPVLCVSMHFKNTGETPIEVSASFNWENLCGRTPSESVSEYAMIGPAVVDEKPRYAVFHERKEAPSLTEFRRRRPEQEEVVEPPPPPPPNALRFGSAGGAVHNSDGEYCLAVRTPDASFWTTTVWDPGDEEQHARFWRGFIMTGLPDGEPSGCAPCGAVTLRATVEPGGTQRVDFALAWYFPRFKVADVELGNAYTIKRKDAFEVAKHTLEHIKYYYLSSTDWQKRLLSSSLPPWMVQRLVNTNHLFTTNSLCTRHGAVSLFESPDRPRTSPLDLHLYSSLAMLLFFPRFAETELQMLARAEQPDCTGRLACDLGLLRLDDPDLNVAPAVYTGLSATLALTTCRNYFMTGKLVRLQELMPVLRTVMARAVARDLNADGIPDIEDDTMSFDGIPGRGLDSHTASLWLAALRAYSLLAERQQMRDEAARYTLLLKRASMAFDRLYWNEEGGYYQLYPAGSDPLPGYDACHTGQLAGVWIAEFLGLGDLLPREHVLAAVAAIARQNETSVCTYPTVSHDGVPVVSAAHSSQPCSETWPGWDDAHWQCLRMYMGDTDGALEAMRHQRSWIFNAPSRWNAARNIPSEHALSRHVSALSIWQTFYAIHGLFINVPDQLLRILPNLPAGVSSLSVPILMPLSYGWLKYKVDDQDGYRQRIKVSFDSPVHLRRIELEVPAHVLNADITCETPSGPIETRWAFRDTPRGRALAIQLERTISVTQSLLIHITKCAPQPKATGTG